MTPHERYVKILAPYDHRGHLTEQLTPVPRYTVTCPFCGNRRQFIFNSTVAGDHFHCFNCKRTGNSMNLWYIAKYRGFNSVSSVEMGRLETPLETPEEESRIDRLYRLFKYQRKLASGGYGKATFVIKNLQASSFSCLTSFRKLRMMPRHARIRLCKRSMRIRQGIIWRNR